jgi:hypothetical protein
MHEYGPSFSCSMVAKTRPRRYRCKNNCIGRTDGDVDMQFAPTRAELNPLYAHKILAVLQRQHIFRFVQTRRAAIFDSETRGFCMITVCIHHLEKKKFIHHVGQVKTRR